MRLLLAVLALGFGCCASAPEPMLAPDDSVFVGLDGARHTPMRVEGRANVLIFTTIDCPIANAYSPEIRAIARDHAGQGMRFFLVHVDPEMTVEKASKHASEYGLDLPILLDPQHDLVAKTGVRFTPEAAVLSPAGEIVYRGRIDDLFADLGQKRRAARNRDLRAALRAVVEGRPVPVPRTVAVGCDIPEL